MSNIFTVEMSFADRENAIQTYLHVPELEKSKLIDLTENLDKLHRGELTTSNTTEQGNLLEGFFEELFKSISVLRVQRSSRTGSNEIDVLIKLNQTGKNLRSSRIIPHWFPDFVLLECKNLKKNSSNPTGRANVTNVNKFKAVVDTSSTSVGIFASYHGLSSLDKPGWQNAHGLIHKYALMNLANEKCTLILNITSSDINTLKKNEFNFFEWIGDIYDGIMTDIKIDFQ